MGKFAKSGVLIILAVCTAHAATSTKEAKDSKTVWGSKTLKRETLPTKTNNGAGKSAESFRTAAQTYFGYNGQNGFGGFGGQGFGNGFNNGQFGYSPSYAGGRQGFGQYTQGGGAYNVLDQSNYFGGQQGQNPYFGNYFGGQQGFGSYPYASQGGGLNGAYQFGGPQAAFSNGGFGGFNSGYYPGAGQFQKRNFGFINQGFGNPAFRNPQGTISTSSGSGSIPSSVQVGTGLEVGGNRGFASGGQGGFPSASGQNYIVGNGIGQPAFIGGSGAPGAFGFGGPFGGIYSTGVPGGLYRNPNSLFGGPYDYPRALSVNTRSPSTSAANSSRQSGSAATRLQTTGPNRFYQGVSPAGTYARGSGERLYRYTSNES